jgi:hypothetical protein
MRCKWRSTVRTTGFPTSSNRASSFHLLWEGVPATDEVSAVLEVVEPPTVPHLYFWALQASFVDDRGRRVGGAHLGLQWYPPHPGSTAVNWGGYRDGASLGGSNVSTELEGEASTLPSATGNPNTRDYAWRPHTPYRLRISGDGDGWWRGEVTDLTTGETIVVRRLYGGGTRLAGPMVWSEVFARCDDPSVTVRWSDFTPHTNSIRTSYQRHEDGGCANTRSTFDPATDSWLQTTNQSRTG